MTKEKNEELEPYSVTMLNGCY